MPPRLGVRVVGRQLDPESQRLRDLLTRAAQPFEWIEAGGPTAQELLSKAGLEDPELPVVIDEEQAVTGATRERLIEAWRLDAPPSGDEYDLVIVGAGPAGLGAAVYAASDGLRTLLVEEDVPGGQASYTAMIENFFGFPEGIGGAELARLAGRQAERFGAELSLVRGVENARVTDGGFEAELAGGYRARSPVAITATGMVWRRLEVEGADELINRGVYYGAGRSEAARCAGDSVVIVGAGNSAGQAVLTFAGAGARVTMAVRGDALAKSMSAYLVERIERHDAIDVRLRTEVVAVSADGERLGSVTLRGPDGKEDEVSAIGLFITIGGRPRTGWAESISVELDRRGFVLTGPDLLRGGQRPRGWPLDRDPLPLETSIPGLFAAGDVRSGSTKRVAAAVGEGSMAVALAWRRLEEIERAR